jgi:fido (protein-threonine AMPylation protein)
MDSASEKPQSLTRYFDTALGPLTYAELSDAIAPHLEALLDRITDGKYVGRQFTDDLVQEFHRDIVGSTLPEIAGKWRQENVRVGNHIPPDYYLVPIHMSQFAGNVQTRLGTAVTDELQIELLAYAEGELLHIHPFTDFNGRANRAILIELITRLDFPPINVSVERNTSQFAQYQAALAEYDNHLMEPLIDFWYERLARGMTESL